MVFIQLLSVVVVHAKELMKGCGYSVKCVLLVVSVWLFGWFSIPTDKHIVSHKIFGVNTDFENSVFYFLKSYFLFFWILIFLDLGYCILVMFIFTASPMQQSLPCTVSRN